MNSIYKTAHIFSFVKVYTEERSDEVPRVGIEPTTPSFSEKCYYQ